MGSQLTICNNAIGRIRAGRISSIDENSLEGRECKHHYPQVVSFMLTKPHRWGFATRRVVLAPAATNDRENEWLYAYNVPSDMAAPIALIPDFEASGVSVPFALPGEPYAEAWTVFPQATAPYIIENGILYSNADGATLAYAVNSVEEAVLPQLVIDAMSLELAQRIAIPVKGMSDADRRAIMQEAEVAWQRAIAEDKNRQPEEYPEYISDREAAREGHY